MIGTLFFFAVSLIGMATMIFYKKVHKTPINFVRRCDDSIVDLLERINLWVKFINRKTIGLLIHFVLEKIESVVNNILKSLKSRVKK